MYFDPNFPKTDIRRYSRPSLSGIVGYPEGGCGVVTLFRGQYLVSDRTMAITHRFESLDSFIIWAIAQDLDLNTPFELRRASKSTLEKFKE